MERFQDICCPRCGWHPAATDRWHCLPDCGAEWNTFWTRGVCPGCQRSWQETQCPACRTFSPHESWYRPEASGGALVRPARARRNA